MKQILNTMTLAALAGLASFANSALASERLHPETLTDTRSITVHFGDLNPALPADASALLDRVRLAARNACLRNDESRQIFLADDREACVAEAYAKAIAAINAKRKVDVETVAARHDGDQNLNAAR
jgi:UrcA family protein